MPHEFCEGFKDLFPEHFTIANGGFPHEVGEEYFCFGSPSQINAPVKVIRLIIIVRNLFPSDLMALVIQFSPSSDHTGILEWLHGDIRLSFTLPLKWVGDLLQLIPQLDRFRGEMSIDHLVNNQKCSLVIRDVFNHVVSYEWIDYGEEPIDPRRFQRLASGKMALSEFEEAVYAAITDFTIILGTEGYKSLLGKPFPQAPYTKLAKKLDRPHALPEIGEEEHDEDSTETLEGDKDWVWESEDGDSTYESDDPPPWLRDPKELKTRDEFLILGDFINKRKKDE